MTLLDNHTDRHNKTCLFQCKGWCSTGTYIKSCYNGDRREIHTSLSEKDILFILFVIVLFLVNKI